MNKKNYNLLDFEVLITTLVTILLLSSIMIASSLNIKEIYQIIIISIGFIIFIIGAIYSLRIEQTVGFYKCKKCNHKHIPTFKNVLLAMHIGRTRYLKCPKCNKYSWNKKIINKENNQIHLKELSILIVQIFIFYIYPIYAIRIDPIGMVLIMLFITLMLSTIISYISNKKIIYIYPIIISLLFLPSILIFYNESALVHSIWYLVTSFIGIIIGKTIKFIIGGK